MSIHSCISWVPQYQVLKRIHFLPFRSSETNWGNQTKLREMVQEMECPILWGTLFLCNDSVKKIINLWEKERKASDKRCPKPEPLKIGYASKVRRKALQARKWEQKRVVAGTWWLRPRTVWSHPFWPAFVLATNLPPSSAWPYQTPYFKDVQPLIVPVFLLLPGMFFLLFPGGLH